jgi:hypothetical protein
VYIPSTEQRTDTAGTHGNIVPQSVELRLGIYPLKTKVVTTGRLLRDGGEQHNKTADVGQRTELSIWHCGHGTQVV